MCRSFANFDSVLYFVFHILCFEIRYWIFTFISVIWNSWYERASFWIGASDCFVQSTAYIFIFIRLSWCSFEVSKKEKKKKSIWKADCACIEKAISNEHIFSKLDLVMKRTFHIIRSMVVSAIQMTWSIYFRFHKKWYIWMKKIPKWRRASLNYGHLLWQMAFPN